MSHLAYAEAMVIGLIQGVTEMFPVSSLGHSVSRPESPYLAFIVGLHVATADQKLAWMIVLATIPVGLSGLEHTFRVVFSKPVPTALFLTVNGVILLAGERARRRSGEHGTARQPAMAAHATPQHAMTPAGYPAQPPGTYPASPLSGLRQQPVQQPSDRPEPASVPTSRSGSWSVTSATLAPWPPSPSTA